MSEWLRQSEEFSAIIPQIMGQVFDSAPGRRTNSSFLRATSASSLGGGGANQQGGWIGSAYKALLPYAFLALAYLYAAWRALLGKALERTHDRIRMMRKVCIGWIWVLNWVVQYNKLAFCGISIAFGLST